ncbi:RNA polymerase sigma factor [Sphingorhabdus contaminans]|uniref:RNA polymerase sigma factor n=1 Tax=Sphingorhabdus contaminans TaxID=1343899 RepID=UPI001B872DFA|nr:RNA polymerase sigma factor [Sphingorhabdus contaminans]
MSDDIALHGWFCREVLPLERALTHYIRRNLRDPDAVTDVRQEIYERALLGARRDLPINTQAYLYTIARNLLINTARRAQIVSIEHVAELEDVRHEVDMLETERHLNARDELRRAMAALEQLPPRCREVVRLRKVEGYTTRETADHLGVGIDTIEKQLTNGMRAIADFMLGGSGRIKRPAANTARAETSSSATPAKDVP